MNDELAIIEKQCADLIAAEYLGKGYQVLREVPLEFLPGYHADMVVKNGYEIKVVAVKTRPSLAANPGLREFARIVNAQPGWTFELQLVGEPERVDAADNAPSLDEAGILARLAESENALDSGMTEVALLMAWTATEAMLRIMLDAEGLAVERATNPAYVVGMAVAHGAIDRDTYHRLLSIMKYRNAIAHGFAVSDLTGALVTELIGIVNFLLRDHREFEAWYAASAGVGEYGEP